MWSFAIVSISVLCSLISPTYSQGFCRNPEGANGVCINIKACPALLNLLQFNNQDENVRIFLRSSVCGYEGFTPLVCCPFYVNGNRGDTQNNQGEIENNRGDKEDIKTAYGPLYPPNCGFSNVTLQRVVGGTPAPLGAWPWITALGYRHRKDPNLTRWLCGGALISSRHVLTAAHCVYNRNDLYKVRVGDLDLERNDDGAFPFEDFIDRKVVHPKYDPTRFTNDVAVLRTNREVPFTLYIHPICLPVDDYHKTKNFENTYPFIAGWGSLYYHGPTSSRLMQLQLPVRTEQQCKLAFQKIQEATIDNRVLCAGYIKGGKDACQGDSGGPLMSPSPKDRSYYVIGIVSYGLRCAEPGIPGVYTKVTTFLDFILSQLV